MNKIRRLICAGLGVLAVFIQVVLVSRYELTKEILLGLDSSDDE